MSVSCEVEVTCRVGQDTIGGKETFTEGQEIRLSEAIADSSTDLAVALAFAKDKLKVICLYSDQDVTLEFNSGSVPAPAISLAAGVPYLWRSTSGQANPFSVDVTGLYVTNSSGATATVDAIVIVDPT